MIYIIQAVIVIGLCALFYYLGYTNGNENGRNFILGLKDKEISVLRQSYNLQQSEYMATIAGLKDELAKEKDRPRREAQARHDSRFARDFENDKPFEIVQVPTETVTLRAAVEVDYHDLETLTKEEVLRQLRSKIALDAMQYVEVRQMELPGIMGARIEGRLRVLDRR